MNGIDINEKVKFKSKYETDKERPTIFVLRILSYKERLEYVEIFSTGQGTMQKYGELVQKSLVRIQDLKIGNEYKDFETVDDAAMDAIHPKVFVELSNHITVINGITGEESKN